MGKGRIPVKEFLTKQGRYAHLKDEHYADIQKMVDEMWDDWKIPAVAPIKGILRYFAAAAMTPLFPSRESYSPLAIGCTRF